MRRTLVRTPAGVVIAMAQRFGAGQGGKWIKPGNSGAGAKLRHQCQQHSQQTGQVEPWASHYTTYYSG